MPVVVAVVVLVNVLGGDASEDGGTQGPADVDATTEPQRADLPPLPVTVPPAPPEAEAPCTAVMGALPLELAGETSRLVDSDTPYAYAWGDPAVVLVCGVDPPAGYVVGASTFVISGVEWFVDDSDPDVVVWTTVDRNVPVQVSVPTSTDSASVTALCPIISTALPYVTPTPGG